MILDAVLLRKPTPVRETGKLDLATIMAEVERPKQEFLELLAKLTKQNTNVSASPNATNYAPKVMVKRERVFSREKKRRVTELETAMNDLLDEGRIENQQYGPKCRNTFKLVGLPRRKPKEIVDDNLDVEMCVSPQNENVSPD
jgi:hypothetical protein